MMDVVEVTCAVEGCGYSPFPMQKAYNERCHRTHEMFYCPAGHSLSYQGKTKEEKRIASLEQDVKALREHLDWLESHQKRLRRELVRCQWVGCGFQAKDRNGLWTHMRAIHGMPTLTEVSEAV